MCLQSSAVGNPPEDRLCEKLSEIVDGNQDPYESQTHTNLPRIDRQVYSNDMRPEQKLDWGNATTQIPFGVNLHALTPAGTAALTPATPPPMPTSLTGRFW